MVARNQNGNFDNACFGNRSCRRDDRAGAMRSHGSFARHDGMVRHPRNPESSTIFGISYDDIKGKSFDAKMTKRQMASLVAALTFGSLFCMVFGA